MNEHRAYMAPTAIRIWHWLNALGVTALCASGAQIRFPEHVNLFGSYKSAIALHDTAGMVVTVSFTLWLLYYLRHARTFVRIYFPNRDDLRSGMFRQAKFYFLTYFYGQANPHVPTPQNKFNPLQKAAYLFIMLLVMPLTILTGLLLLNITPLRQFIFAMGGLNILMNLHFLLASILTAFLVTHIYLSTMGHTPLAHFKTMWTGWEDSGGDSPRP